MAYEIKQVKVVLLINMCVYQLKKPNLTIWYRRKSLMEQLSFGLNACKWYFSQKILALVPVSIE